MRKPRKPSEPRKRPTVEPYNPTGAGTSEYYGRIQMQLWKVGEALKRVPAPFSTAIRAALKEAVEECVRRRRNDL